MRRSYGFIHEKIEIKMLILFILRRLPDPVPLESLMDLAMCDGGISYFDFMDSLTELVKTEHLQQKDDMYSLTDKGVRNGKTTEKGLPLSVRMDAEKTIFEYRSTQTRNDMIMTSHEINPDGSCKVTLSLADGLGEIVSMEMFAVNERQALALEKGFRKNAESVYNMIVGTILA